MTEWEAEIKIRRNGRLVKMERALGSSAETALYNVHNDVELWTQRQESAEQESARDWCAECGWNDDHRTAEHAS